MSPPGHPQQGPAAAPQLALDPVRLEDQVRRRLGVAQVADVGVGVVGDHRAVAHGAEQGAVVEVRLQAAALGEVVQRALRAGQDLVAHAVVGRGERPAQVADLVHGEGQPLRVHDVDPALAGAEAHVLVDQHACARRVRDPHAGPAVQERAQRRRPLHEHPAPVGVPVAGRGERPDVATVHGEHEGLVAGRAHVDAAVVHPSGDGRRDDVTRAGPRRSAHGGACWRCARCRGSRRPRRRTAPAVPRARARARCPSSRRP